MNIHKNARLTPLGRERIVLQVLGGKTPEAKTPCGSSLSSCSAHTRPTNSDPPPENAMNIHQEAMRIVFQAQEGTAPTKEECAFLLDLPDASFEAGILKAAADAISRAKFADRGILLGQIGVEIAPCPGGCKFCSFAPATNWAIRS